MSKHTVGNLICQKKYLIWFCPTINLALFFRLENLKKISKWCYNCGRTVGMKLLPCSRCKKVYFCSNSCKQKAWLEIHKNECQLADNRKFNISYLTNQLDGIYSQRCLFFFVHSLINYFDNNFKRRKKFNYQMNELNKSLFNHSILSHFDMLRNEDRKQKKTFENNSFCYFLSFLGKNKSTLNTMFLASDPLLAGSSAQ